MPRVQRRVKKLGVAKWMTTPSTIPGDPTTRRQTANVNLNVNVNLNLNDIAFWRAKAWEEYAKVKERLGGQGDLESFWAENSRRLREDLRELEEALEKRASEVDERRAAANMPLMTMTIRSGTPPVAANKAPLPKGPGYATIRFPRQKIPKQAVRIKKFPPVTPIPPMLIYTYTPKGYRAKDETVLRNIPFMGDHVIEHEGEFINDLTTLYDNKVHSEDERTCEDKLRDDMFFALVNSLAFWFEKLTTPRPTNVDGPAPQNKGGEGVAAAGEGSDEDILPDEVPINVYTDKDNLRRIKLPSPLIFEAISQVFPKEGSAEQLHDRFVNDFNKFSQGEILLPEYMPNIDGGSAASAPRPKTMNSFHTLFCRRCYIYDCSLHPIGVDDNIASKPSMLDKKTPEVLSELPCGPCCYSLGMDDETTESSSSSSTSSREREEAATQNSGGRGRKRQENIQIPMVLGEEPPFVSIFKSTDPKWTNAEESLYRAVHKVFGKNFCLIARTMMTRTCEEVCAFYKREEAADGSLPPTGLDDDDEGASCSKKNVKERRRKPLPQVVPTEEGTGGKEPCYNPCEHPGPCIPNNRQCACYRNGTYCEKFCSCSDDCLKRFPGCQCRAQCNTNACPCYIARRECDPDSCLTCGAAEHITSDVPSTCKNVNCQRHENIHLLLAPSDVAGWGVFIKEGLMKNEFIAEYTGEIITHDEADRRGKIYDKAECSFLFDLNTEYVIDATRKGNKMRFANHSEKPNCYAKILKVNGDHRVSFFSKRDIDAGEELFFDYSSKLDKLDHAIPIYGAGSTKDKKKSKSKKSKYK